MQFLDNRARFLYPIFLGLYGRDPATILNFFLKDFSFFLSYGYTNILCHIFNSARNNQQQLVIFIHVMVSAGVYFGGKEKLHFISDKTKVKKLMLKPRCRNLFKNADLFCHQASSFNRMACLQICTDGKAGLRLDCDQLQ